MDKVDITIIGAGVVGLAIASRISKPELSVVVLEKNEKFGQETSSRNSEVVHSGIYYPKDCLKTSLCVRGNKLIYAHCDKFGIKYSRLGKIVVATTQEETKLLEELYLNAKNNGINNLKLLDRKQVNELERGIEAFSGLLCPDTGIVDTHSLMQSFVNIAKAQGAMITYDSEVIGIEKIKDGYELIIKKDNYCFQTSILVNCAGLNSDKIAELAGIDITKAGYKIYYCKGNYFRTTQELKIQRLVYPVPKHNDHGLGIHLTPDLAGNFKFGPDTRYVENIDYTVDEDRKDLFYESVRKYIPYIQPEHFYPDTSGIRPKLQGPNDGFRDFVIVEESNKGLPGFINLIGIDSPGLTSAIAISEYVEQLIKTRDPRLV